MISERGLDRYRVGEIRPSQLLYVYGVGSVVDLPNLSAIILGLDDWDTSFAREIGEERLLANVRQELGHQVELLRSPPEAPDEEGGHSAPSDGRQLVGIPIAPFPRWLLCPFCRLLAPIQSDLFTLKRDQYRPDRTRYVHGNCRRVGQPPTALPARFLVACENGHLDDFPWDWYVHRGQIGCRSRLRLREFGMSGEAIEIEVQCDECKAHRRLAEAFGEDAEMPLCSGRRPHLRDFEDEPCPARAKTILLGASNSWFPLSVSALSVPTAVNQLEQLVADNWVELEHATSREILAAFRGAGHLRPLARHSEDAIWAAVEARRNASPAGAPSGNLKAPEWRVFAECDPSRSTRDFRLREVPAPTGFGGYFEKVVLAERLREVRALVGFTRIESPGDFDELGEVPEQHRSPLSKRPPRWLPAVETRGEGIFLQLREQAVDEWVRKAVVDERNQAFLEAHRRWRAARRIQPPEAGFGGIRYVLLHTLSHALMRQLAVESGYAMASIRERIYSLPPTDEDGPMAGILLYTAASDSEGTLGGLVSLGEPIPLGRHLAQALERASLCASDPWCAEHHPTREGPSLHGAACHACLFAPETSCERGNKYLDRCALTATMNDLDLAFFRNSG